MGRLTKHVDLLIDTYPGISEHIDKILSGKKPHTIEMYEDGLLVYKVVPKKYVKVNVFHVLPESRQRGTGTLLLGVLQNLCHEHNLPVTISIPVDNVSFINWLLSEKFISNGILVNKYKEGVDMYLLSYWEVK